MPKTVLITGAAGALAAAVNRTFADADWHLALLEYSADKADRLRQEYPEAVTVQVDLTDEEAARQAVNEVLAATGGIDAVLNLAGGFSMQDAAEATADDLARMHELNFVTLFNTVRAVLPAMQARRRGFLLGVSAAAAESGGAGMGLYAATKAAVATYLKSLRAELAADGIQVSVLYPMGAIDTPANRKAMPNFPEDQWVRPDELAQAMLFLATRGPQGSIGDLKVAALATLG